MGVALSENFGDLLEPGLRQIFTEQYEAMEEMRPMLFNTQSSSTSYEKDSSVGALTDLNVFKGAISYDDVVQGYDVTYRHVRLAGGFQIERDLVEDDLYNVIAKKPRELALASGRTYEKYGASIINNAFTGSGSVVVDGVTVLSNSEGQSLCSTAHPYSPDDSTTQSNSGTTALSPTAVETVRRAMRRVVDDRGNKIHVRGDTILVPLELEETGYEIIASMGKVDSAENNANFHFGKYKLAVWDYLTDANNWFMVDSSLMKINGLNWFDRVPLQFMKTNEFDTLIAKYAVTSRVSFGFGDWRFVYGQNVAD